MSIARRHTFGIVGGLGGRSDSGLYRELARLSPSGGAKGLCDILLEQHPFPEPEGACEADAKQTARKLYIFDAIRSFERRGVDTILLPCFISACFLDELRAELDLPVLDLTEAIRIHLEARYSGARRLGILTSDYVRSHGLFERVFGERGYTLVYPSDRVQADCVMPEIRAAEARRREGEGAALLGKACVELAQRGAELVIPAFARSLSGSGALPGCPLPLLDCDLAYAEYAMAYKRDYARPIRKIGIVGGVGPAATVDFMAKILRNTPAHRDQDHVKIVVEQNPQIPDRTANLVAGGVDPTIALYAACKRLEADEADIIAIPCNTAHAFAERIQPYLGIPIVNMLTTTLRHIAARYPAEAVIGLLATDGTVRSGVYREAAEKAGLKLVTPEEPYQRRVMEAVYGAKGAKAGFTEGACKEDLLAAMEHLARDKAAEVLVLGCTELPLILAQSEAFPLAGRLVAVLDPTEILAKACVELVLGKG